VGVRVRRFAPVGVADPHHRAGPIGEAGAGGGEPRSEATPSRLLKLTLRASLIGLAGLQMFRGVPGLFTAGHLGGEIAAWQVAVAVAFATAAAAPRVVDSLMPIMAGGTVMTVLVSLRDVAEARTTTRAELSHLILVAGFAMLTLLWLGHHEER
jgi:predicted anti-sigma-YlaC factor YlaD